MSADVSSWLAWAKRLTFLYNDNDDDDDNNNNNNDSNKGANLSYPEEANFFYISLKTWQTVYTSNKKLARLVG